MEWMRDESGRPVGPAGRVTEVGLAVLYGGGLLEVGPRRPLAPGFPPVLASWEFDASAPMRERVERRRTPWVERGGEGRRVRVVGGLGSPCPAGWFAGLGRLERADISGLAGAGPLDARLMFLGCCSLAEVVAQGGLRLSCARRMFSGCSLLSAVDVSGWEVAPCCDAAGMFEGCALLAACGASGGCAGGQQRGGLRGWLARRRR